MEEKPKPVEPLESTETAFFKDYTKPKTIQEKQA